MQSVIFPISNGVALIDEADLREVVRYKWYLDSSHTTNYAREMNCRFYMHQLILKPKKGMQVDHINGDGLDNRRCNLRACTVSQNIANSGIRKNNTTGFKGVWLKKGRKKKWYAKIEHKNKIYHLGGFYSKIEAAFAYDKKAVEIFGEFARLNFPNEIDYASAIDKIKNSNGRIIKVAFTKRSDGSERIMLCRIGVNKGLTGKGLSYNPEERNVFVVYDMIKHCYRMLPLENLKALWMDKKQYKVA